MSIRLRMEPWGRSHGGYSPSTFARDESALRVHLLPALRSRRIGSLDPGDVRGLVTD